jgi:polysaccharide biosynthesis transport protein
VEARKAMQTQEQQQSAGLSLADIYYILFRNKWKIIILSVAGVLAAAVVYFIEPRPYRSEAKLFIRYVVESKVPSGIVGEPQIKTLDSGGANIMNSETEIIRSWDLAVQVVKAIGADKIIGKGAVQTNDETTAAGVVLNNLTVESARNSDILHLTFQNPNQEIVRPVLSQLIDSYLRRHVEIHRSMGGFDDLLQKQTDELRTQLSQTEADLQQAKTNAGVMSIEYAKDSCEEALTKTRQEVYEAQTDLAGLQASLEARQKLLPVKAETPNSQPEPEVPRDKLEDYRGIRARLDTLRNMEREMLTRLTDKSTSVRSIREQIASVEKDQRKLEADYPRLTRMQLAPATPGGPVIDLSEDITRITALLAKIKVLTNRLDVLTAQARNLSALEPAVTKLQREKDLEEAKYRHFSTSLEQSKFDTALSAGKNSNISVAQEPTPPYRESRKLMKTLAMLAVGGVVSGLALAFLTELFLDPTVRRPGEVESRLRLPLFLTIPQMHGNSHLALPAPNEASPEPASNPEAGLATSNGNGTGPYWEALRDRLVTFFEVNNLTHKPKLIAVTGCGKGAGATTIATGLAASLSETGDGNVLVVDMTAEQGAAHPFFRGKPGTGLAEALITDKRNSALVQDNLYAVAERGTGGQLPRILPRRFSSLVPKLKASDYDYIIFDMPPVNQISVTPRLAGFMDMVLLVIESEKTDRDVVKRATSMLAESKANVRAILNKNRSYVPKRLLQEL